jgi:hypothetical protein
MRYLGIADGKMAYLSAKGVIEKLTSEEPLSEKNLYTVSGLTSEQVVRREVSLKLKRKRDILKALTFQLDSLAPLNLLYPQLHPTQEGTDVVVFATSQARVQEHLKKVNTDQISCTPMALFRFLRFVFPNEPKLKWIYGNTAIALEGKKIVFAQHLDDVNRLKAFLDLKFQNYVEVPTSGPALCNIPYETLLEFAIPIGLALDGQGGCQFKPKQRPLKAKMALFCLGLALLTGAIGFTLLHHQTHLLKQKVSAYFSCEDSLETALFLWKQKLDSESKEIPLLADVPSVSDTLSFLSAISSVEIVQFHYSLVKYPKAGEKRGPYAAKVELEFKANGPKEAEDLQAQLTKSPTLIDTKQKVIWTAHQNSYKMVFWLRKSSLSS